MPFARIRSTLARRTRTCSGSRTDDMASATGSGAGGIRAVTSAACFWSPVSSYYVSRQSDSTGTSAPDAFRRAPSASMDLLVGLVPKITGLLTDDQRRAMPAGISIYLDSGYLTAIGAGP